MHSNSLLATSLPVFPAPYGTVNGSFALFNPTLTSGEDSWTLPGPRLGIAPRTLHGPGAAHDMHASSRIACGGASGATFPNDTPPPGLPGTGSSGDGVSLDEGAGP